jgi:predicted RecA/RadA family phage recombinase
MKKSLSLLIAVAAVALCAVAAHAAGADLSSFITPDVGLGLAGLGAAGMLNYVQDGEVLDLTPGAAVAKGEGYLFGAALFGVAVDAVANGVEGRFLTKPGCVVEIAKTSALAIAVGDRLFWDAANKCVNKTSAGQQQVGVAVAAAANPSSTVKMRMLAALPAAT